MGSEIINLTCPSCGGKLQIKKDMDRFACGYCGNEQVVVRSGGTITLAPVINEIKHVSRGVDKTASELAITRIDREISELRKEQTILNTQYKKESGGFAVAVIGMFFGVILLYTKLQIIGILLLIVCVPWLVIGFLHLRSEIKDVRAIREEINECLDEKADHVKNVKVIGKRKQNT